MIYLRHPIHGAKVATMEMEANFDEMNGWERYDPDAEELEPVNELRSARRGRRPVPQEA